MIDRTSVTDRSTATPQGAPRARWTTICALTLIGVVVMATPASAQLNKTMHTDGWILAAAHAPGYQGSIWRTDLWVRFESSYGSVTLTFCESGVDNTNAETFEIQSNNASTVYIEDVVDHHLGLGGGSWTGAIHYVADRNVQVYARVYSISPDGSSSYGQLIEGIPTRDMSMSPSDPGFPNTRELQWMFAAKHTSDGRFRVNVGAVNPTAVEGTAHIRAFDETGNNPPDNERFTVVVPPYSMIQLSDPFENINGGDWDAYTIRVEIGGEGSGVFGYASVVDNATNDAYFVRGVKLFDVDD